MYSTGPDGLRIKDRLEARGIGMGIRIAREMMDWASGMDLDWNIGWIRKYLNPLPSPSDSPYDWTTTIILASLRAFTL
jgi:hypothetical protein